MIFPFITFIEHAVIMKHCYNFKINLLGKRQFPKTHIIVFITIILSKMKRK
ncbi:CLUMA_CG006936, isoform A [Clunio marinus]|uniref:CLUMA_CG006936, isoform A n=1 Tax=Clunio marinus TaxID=568069 RepID=A0A1J1HZ71_9DIPT|nr:CLUMA_CG006936, isoform A [Clunio marinus]